MRSGCRNIGDVCGTEFFCDLYQLRCDVCSRDTRAGLRERAREESLPAPNVEYMLALDVADNAKDIRLEYLLVVGVFGFRHVFVIPIRNVPPRSLLPHGFFGNCGWADTVRSAGFYFFAAHISITASSRGKYGTAA